MSDLWLRLKQRKIVQWAVAYIGGAFALLQGIDIVAQQFGWPEAVQRGITLALVLGFFVTLLLAWYHGEQGRQRVSGTELLLIALVLAFGGGFLWWLAATPSAPLAPKAAASGAPAATRVAVASSVTAPASIPPKSIAVLPFESLSEDKGNKYFADGMQDLILTKLADIGELKVISRTSTRAYGSKPENLKRIARELGVATVLEGSVQKAGNQVLINVQLIDARSDTHLWAKTYQRTLDNIFGVEGEVAGKVADALKAKLSPTEVAAVSNVPTRNPAAYDAFLRGERLRDQAFSTADFKLLPKAVAAFRQAIDHDPAFAQAWAKLAGSQSLLMYTSIDSSEANCQQSLANARHALALAPDLPLGHLVLGYAYRFCRADYDRALDQFRIARKGLPNNADVEAAIAYIDWIKGDKRAVVAGLQRAVSLDPRSPDRTMYLAQAWEALGRYDRARASFNRALALAPDDPEIWSGLAYLAALQHGDVEAALRTLDRAPAALQSGAEIVRTRVELLLLKRDYAAARDAALQLQPGGRDITPMRVALLRAEVDRLSGDTKGAKAMYRQALSLARDSHVAESSETAVFVQSMLPSIYAGLGRRDQALQALAKMLRMAKHNGSNYDDLAELKRAKIRVLLGDDDAAIAPLDVALAAPLRNSISVPLLKIDPFWDPIRKNPRFQALLTKYANRPPDQARNGAGDD